MNRTLLRYLTPGFAPTLAAAFLVVAVGCGTTVVEPAGTGGSTGTGGSAGTQGTGGATACHLQPTGTFTFHVHNAGTQMLRLTLGCGVTLPIVLATPQGTLNIGPGLVDTCGFTCDEVYAGTAGTACSDCGGGVATDLAPGVTADIVWDRRIYVEQMVDPQCAPQAAGGSCAFGEAVAPVVAQSGVLTTCSDGGTTLNGGYGDCTSAGAAMVSFTVDTTKTEGTIEVQ